MRINFVCPSSTLPTGGVVTLYEFANRLARLGHDVRVAHGGFWGRNGIAGLDDIDWFRFDPRVRHFMAPAGTAVALPDADVIFGTGAPEALGLPVLLLQGLDMLPGDIEREVLSTPCLMVCVAEWLMRRAAELGAPSEQLVYVPAGIDHDAFTVKVPLAERAPCVGALYHDHPAKGWPTGWAALEEAHARRPAMRVVLFGIERPPQPLPDWVDFHLGPTRAELAALYNRCGTFLQSSEHEGLGLTALEAMACGCALVSTDNGGSAEYAQHERSALVSPPGDPAALADHLVRLLDDQELRFQLANAGRVSAKRFTWERAGARLEEALTAYLDRPGDFRASA